VEGEKIEQENKRRNKMIKGKKTLKGTKGYKKLKRKSSKDRLMI